MNANITNFRRWFVDAIKPLEKNGHAGFIFAMVSFPLLERYLRGKYGVSHESNLSINCFKWLDDNLPDICKRGSEFWCGYRNGLLHQVSFQNVKKNKKGSIIIPESYISGHDARPVYYKPDENHFYLNPTRFHEFVVSTILADFDSYEKASINLPQVGIFDAAAVTTCTTAGAIQIKIDPTEK